MMLATSEFIVWNTKCYLYMVELIELRKIFGKRVELNYYVRLL